jgi:hypothetical protein
MLNLASITRWLIAVAASVGMLLILSASTSDEPRERFRYHDVSIEMPPDSFRVSQRPALTPEFNPTFSHRPVIEITQRDDHVPGVAVSVGWIMIDAETGEILADTLSDDYPDLDATIRTIVVHTEPPDAWPLSATRKPQARYSRDNVSVLLPSPASGVLVGYVISYCRNPCADTAIHVVIESPGFGSVWIDTENGDIVEIEAGTPEVRAALDRFIAEVEVTPTTDPGD